MGIKIAIHQPEHFPYVGFFQKMEACDVFVILDDVQFTKNNFQNRNRFLNTNGVEEWFTVPVPSNANSLLIKDIVITDKSNWRKKLCQKVLQNLKIDILEVYEASNNLCQINVDSIEFIRKKLDIKTPMVFSSELNVEGNKSEKLLNICKKLSANCYISGKGGIEYLDVGIFNREGIKIEFYQSKLKDYYTTLSHLKDYEYFRDIP